MENKKVQEQEDKVIKKNFLGDLNINKKELENENYKYYAEKNNEKLVKMMSIKVARIERLLIYFGSAILVFIALVFVMILWK